MSDRQFEKEELLYKLGMLFGPIENMVEQEDAYSSDDQSRILARFFAEYGTLAAEFKAFSTGEAGHDYRVAYGRFRRALQGFCK